MTQEKANKIFDTPLGMQIASFFCTSDDRVFIRYSEAQEHINDAGLVDGTIEEWFPE